MEALSFFNVADELVGDDELNIADNFTNRHADLSDVSNCDIVSLTSEFDAEDTSNIQYWDSPLFANSTLPSIPEDEPESLQDVEELEELSALQETSLVTEESSPKRQRTTSPPNLMFQWLVRIPLLTRMRKQSNLHCLKTNSMKHSMTMQLKSTSSSTRLTLNARVIWK